jgi:hypothetical protein
VSRLISKWLPTCSTADFRELCAEGGPRSGYVDQNGDRVSRRRFRCTNVLDDHRHAALHLDDGDRLFDDGRRRRAATAAGYGGGQEAAAGEHGDEQG